MKARSCLICIATSKLNVSYVPSPMESTRPVSSRFDFGAAPRILSSRMEEISAEAGAAVLVDSFLAITPMAAAFLDT